MDLVWRLDRGVYFDGGGLVRAFIWKMKFARRMRQLTKRGFPIGFCWEVASIWVNEQNWEEEDPEDAAYEELCAMQD